MNNPDYSRNARYARTYRKLTKKNDYSEVIEIDNTRRTKKNYTGLPLHWGGGGNLTLAERAFGKAYSAVPTEFYLVRDKKEYAQRARDVRSSLISAAIRRKFGKITEKDHLMLKSLLQANLYFARLSLYFSKMKQILDILYYRGDSIIKNIHKSLFEIFNIQEDIQSGYISTEGLDKKLTPKAILAKINAQEKSKHNLVEISLFKDAKEISKGCGNINKTGITKKVLICILNIYRKYEAKFNKYYHKFSAQIVEFERAYGCIKQTDQVKLELLDIRKTANQSKKAFVQASKCETTQSYDYMDKLMEGTIREEGATLGDQLLQKSKEQKEAVSEKFSEYMTSLKDTLAAFNKHIEDFNKTFRGLEYFGIHRYAGSLPRTKRLFERFLGQKAYQLVNPMKLKELATDKNFIEDFDKMMMRVAEKSKTVVLPSDKEFKEIIPTIKLALPAATTPPTPTTPAPTTPLAQTTLSDNDIQRNFKIFTMNMDGVNMNNLAGDDFEQILNHQDPNNKQYPTVICIQNGTSDMKTRQSAFCYSFLKNMYIPVAFSSHGKTVSGSKDTIERSRFNIILVRTDAILAEPNKPDYIKNLQPVNQSSQFVMNDLPAGMTLDNNQKSFAAANFMYTSADATSTVTSTARAVCVVTTELVGSKASDMFYANKVRDFKYTTLDNRQHRGLRGAQLTTLLTIIKNYNGEYPEFIVGDLGGSPLALLTSDKPGIVTAAGNPAQAPGQLAWDYFKKNYTDLVPYFNAPVTPATPNGNNFNEYLSNGFDDVLMATYGVYTPYTIPPATQPAGQPSQPYYTKLIPPMITNFIFARTPQLRANKELVLQNMVHLIRDILDYGGNVPIVISFDISGHNSKLAERVGKQATGQQARVDTSVAIKLFTETELQDILASIDQLMSVFAYGRIPYLRRDMGCFSLRDGAVFSNRQLPELYDKKRFSNERSLLRVPIKKIKFANLGVIENYPENAAGIQQLKDLYCLEMPGIVESFLFQKTGFFADASKLKLAAYYSQNQTTSTASIFKDQPKFTTKLKIIEAAQALDGDEKLLNPDIAIRLMIMPKSHLKLVMGIDIEKISAKNLRKMTQMALKNFYGSYAVQRLEARLSEILNSRTGIGSVSHNNLIAYLMEKTEDGSLKNIGDGDAVLDLFEMMFIFLRLKFIDKQLFDYNVEVAKEQEKTVGIEKEAQKALALKVGATKLYESIVELAAINEDPLRQILYNAVIQRTAPVIKQVGGAIAAPKPTTPTAPTAPATSTTSTKYLLTPVINKDQRSFQESVKGFKVERIQPRPIDELQKQKLLGLQFMESYLANSLGIRMKKIEKILKDQVVHPKDRTPFSSNLADDYNPDGGASSSITGYKVEELEDTIKQLHNATQIAGITDVKLSNDVYSRCKVLIQNIKDTYKLHSYFIAVVDLLNKFGYAIHYLIIFENNPESGTVTKANITREVATLLEQAEGTLKIIKGQPYKLTASMEIILEQIKQVKARIDNDLASDVYFTLLNPFPSTRLQINYPLGVTKITPNYQPTIYDISLRSAYFIFDKMISLVNPIQTKPIAPPAQNARIGKTDYTEIMNLCDLLEIGFDYMVKYKEATPGQTHRLTDNDRLLFENYELLVKISRYIWICADIFNKGENAYGEILVKPQQDGSNKIKLSDLFEDIGKCVKDFSDKLTERNGVLCSYVLTPINLLMDFSYHIANSFGGLARITATNPLNPNPPNPKELELQKLYNTNKIFLQKANEYQALARIRSTSNITVSTVTSNLLDGIGMTVTQFDYGNLARNIGNVSGIQNTLDSYTKLEEVVDFAESKIEGKNYNQFKMEALKQMEESDTSIGEMIRNLQTNDLCDNKDDATPLEYEVKYKPGIFSQPVTFYSNAVDNKQREYDNDISKCDNKMLYVFLDVLDYYKNNKEELKKDVVEFIGSQLIISIKEINGKAESTEQFSTLFEKKRLKLDTSYNSDNYVNFKTTLQRVFKSIPDNIQKYLLDGRNYTDFNKELAVDNDNTTNNNFILLLHCLLYMRRFKDVIDGKNINDDIEDKGFISILGNPLPTPIDFSVLTDGKKFCYEYFKGNEIDFDDNMYIKLDILRNYFCKVIYDNDELKSIDDVNRQNIITKEKKLQLILWSVYALSYLLNHNPSKPLDYNSILQFGLLILGVSVFRHYTPALYFKISVIVTNEDNQPGTLIERFIETLLKNEVSYSLAEKHTTEIDKINNSVIDSYLKSLCVYKSNVLAKDIYASTFSNNCFKLLELFNSSILADKLKDEAIMGKLQDMVKYSYYARRLEVLLGTREQGLLSSYCKKYSLLVERESITESQLLHKNALGDYLKSISFFDIRDKLAAIKEITNTSDINAVNIYEKTVTEDGRIDVINNLFQFIDKVKANKKKLFENFFQELLFDLPKQIYTDETNNFDYKLEHPLYFYAKLVSYLQDCLMFVLNYYVPNQTEANMDTPKYIEKITNYFKIIYEIFKNEINTLLKPYFVLSISGNKDNSKDNSDILEYIKNNLANLDKLKYKPDYTYIGKGTSETRGLFELIHVLLTGKDADGNYFMIGDVNLLQGYLTGESVNFFKEITENGFLFNDKDVQLNNKFYNNLLTGDKKLQHDYMNAAGALSPALTINACKDIDISGNKHYIFTHNRNIKFCYYNINLLMKILDNQLNKFVYFDLCLNEDSIIKYLKIKEYLKKIIKGLKDEYNLIVYDNNLSPATQTDEKFFKNIKQENINLFRKIYKEIDKKTRNNNLYQRTNDNELSEFIQIYNDAKEPGFFSIFDDDKPNEYNILKKLLSNFFNDVQISENDYRHNFGTDHNFATTPKPETFLQKLIKCINDICFDSSSNTYENIQAKIKEAMELFNKLMEKINEQLIELRGRKGDYKITHSADSNNIDFKYYKDKFLYKKIGLKFVNINILNNNQLDENIDQSLIQNLIEREYAYTEELFQGVKDSLLDLISLIPHPLVNENTNRMMNHRNNIFLATSLLGFANMKTIDFNCKYNAYLDTKLYFISKTTELSEIDLYRKMMQFGGAMQIYNEFFMNQDIFDRNKLNHTDIDEINTKLVKSPAITDKKTYKDFIILRDTQVPNPNENENIAKDYTETQFCRVYTHPYFNFNSTRYNDPTHPISSFGTEGKAIPSPPPGAPVNFKLIHSQENYKLTLLHFIKYNYDMLEKEKPTNANLLQFINELLDKLDTTTEAKSIDKKKFNEEWKKQQSMITMYKTNSDYKNQITNIYNNLLEVVGKFNVSNKILFKQLKVLIGQQLTNEKINDQLAPLLLELLYNNMNIDNLNQFTIKVLVDVIFGLLVIFNIVSGKYNIPIYKYDLVKKDFISSNTSDNMVKFMFVYLTALSGGDIDISQLTGKKLDDLYKELEQPDATPPPKLPSLKDKSTLNEFIGNDNITLENRDMLEHIRVLNPSYLQNVIQDIAKYFTKQNNPSLAYDNSRLISMFANSAFYGSNVFDFLSNYDPKENRSKYMREDFNKLAVHSKLLEYGKEFKNLFSNRTPKILIGGGSSNIIRPKTIKIYTNNNTLSSNYSNGNITKISRSSESASTTTTKTKKAIEMQNRRKTLKQVTNISL